MLDGLTNIMQASGLILSKARMIEQAKFPFLHVCLCICMYVFGSQECTPSPLRQVSHWPENHKLG